MPPRKQPWFRFYVEAIWDRKLRRLTPAHRWLWIAVLACAKQSPIPGLLLVSDATPASEDDLADAAAIRVADVRTGLKAFESLGLIEMDPHLNTWCVTRWTERQFESDDTAERTAKHRSNVVTTPDVVTPPENREQRTDTDSETEETIRAFSNFWDRYPKRNGKKIGKGQALTAWKRLKDSEREAALVGVKHYRAACDGGITLAKDAHRWLTQRTFIDWQEPAQPNPTNGHAPFVNPPEEAYRDTRI